MAPAGARSPARFIVFGTALAIAMATIAGRLVQLQLAPPAYAQLGASVQVAVSERASRGLVFDRAGRLVARNVPSWTIAARPADLLPDRRTAVLGRLAELSGVPLAELRATVDSYPGSDQDLVPLLRDVDQALATLVTEEAAELSGVEAVAEPIRQYLDGAGHVDGELLGHLLGYTGPIDPGDVDHLRAKGYDANDTVGRAGIEATYERELRGRDGTLLVERDAQGRSGASVETLVEPRPGVSLMLSIDADMQRMATDALRWGLEASGAEQGTVVAMNPQSGEVLAMASLPAYDANRFARGIRDDDYSAYLADGRGPLRNHAIQDIYPPGSTFKLATALAALEAGVTSATRAWPTYGCYQLPGAPAGQCLADWNRAGFGAIDIRRAYTVSSDSFFYQMALGLGIDRLAAGAGELGFGRPTGIDLPGEAAGIVPSSAWAADQGRPGLFVGEVAQAGIGQNAVAVTPLQLLTAYCAIANGGRLMTPTVVRGEADRSGRLMRGYPPREAARLSFPEDDQRLMRLAARDVITSGHAYNIGELPLPGALSGKTGTAEFGEPLAGGGLQYHSWFVAYLPSEPGATDAELAVVAFTHSAMVPGNPSVEIVKHLLQQSFGIQRDYRLDPRTLHPLSQTQQSAP